MSGILSHPRLIGSKFDRFSRHLCLRSIRVMTSMNGRRRFSAISERNSTAALEGPSCIFVANVETESQETLEALYRQARDAYYNGTPLILDDMFDRVELKLRSYGSQSVVKYPRCSIRRQSTYSDAEEDLSQVLVLASVWILILSFGSSVCLAPILYTCNVAYQETLNAGSHYDNQPPFMEYLHMLNEVLFVVLGCLIGTPIASASVGALQRLWRNDLVGLKGACPNCGEQVFAFVRTNQHNNSSHRATCHVCSSVLEYRTKVEETIVFFMFFGWDAIIDDRCTVPPGAQKPYMAC
ncbi:PGR5-like protein [Drosera capensis]